MISDIENNIIMEKENNKKKIITKILYSLIIIICCIILIVNYDINDINKKNINNRKLINNTNIKCNLMNKNETCSLNGECNSNGICVCYKKYTTYNAKKGIFCNYERKEQLKAFILEMIFGIFGGGYFYLERYVMGIIQCVITILFIYLFFYTPNCCDDCEILSFCFFILIILTLYIISNIMIGLNMLTDNNGIKLEDW